MLQCKCFLFDILCSLVQNHNGVKICALFILNLGVADQVIDQVLEVVHLMLRDIRVFKS